MRTYSPKDPPRNPSLHSSIPLFTIITVITVIAGSIGLGAAIDKRDVFLELQHIELYKFIWAIDPNRLEFRPSRRPRTCHFYDVLDVERLPTLDDQFLQFGTDYDLRRTRAGVQGVGEDVWVFAPRKREGA